MFKKSDTKLIVENWRNFINEDNSNQNNDFAVVTKLINISKDVYIFENLVSNEDKGKFVEAKNIFISNIKEKISKENDIMDYMLDYDLLLKTLIEEVSKRRRSAREHVDEAHLHLLENFLRDNLSNAHDLKKIKQAPQSEIYKYELGYPESDEWIDNLFKFLTKYIHLQHSDADVYRYIEQFVEKNPTAIRQDCKQKINSTKYLESSAAIKAFLVEFLSKMILSSFRSTKIS